ncbi:Rpr2-domain-containing protein [Russula ochroleuca]|uniref:Rpr2-domain-containing protein n=1 Tax=Russula ochroleuca TaxID=152965 RepID=A0A9P5N0E7_9AGAM|nr:Rpr2-domain-containing protein [Russula ochroleuca]
MGKKNKGALPNPSNIVNRDILQRLNFLYQASVYLESISRKCGESVDTGAGPSASDLRPPMGATAVGEACPSTPALSKKAARRKRDREQRKGRIIRAADIGQGYVRAMRLIGQKTTTKMDPTVKRTLCRGCDTVLIPGLSATVRVNSSNTHRHVITTNCLRCKSARRIPAPPVADSDAARRDETAMEADGSGSSIPLKSKRRRGPPPRPPPLFEREGHVIFRGNVQIEPK